MLQISDLQYSILLRFFFIHHWSLQSHYQLYDQTEAPFLTETSESLTAFYFKL